MSMWSRVAAMGPAACATAALCATAAAAARAPEPPGYWSGAADAPVPSTLAGGRVIGVAALDALLKTRHPVLVDVSSAPRRPPQLAPAAPWLPVQHYALPGALWIPGAGAGTVPAELDRFYRARLMQATENRFDVPLVIYCHRDCWLSWNAAKRAIGYGYGHVYWFADGVEGWVAAGHAVRTADAEGPPTAAAVGSAAEPPTLVVLDLELSGDLGGPELVQEHAARLVTESARLRADLAQSGLYRLIDNGPAQKAIDTRKGQQAYLHDCNGCDLDIGRELKADLVWVAWVNRVSGLILTLTYEIHDVNSGQITSRKSYDFRGDSDNTWNHAIDYMVRDLRAAAAPAGG